MTITYEGFNMTYPIQGEIQAEAFSVSILNASTNQESISMDEQIAQIQFKTEREELLKKIISEQDKDVKAELQAQLDELDTKEMERHNENVTNQLVEQYNQQRDADFAKIKMGAGLILVLFIVLVGFIVFKVKSKKKN